VKAEEIFVDAESGTAQIILEYCPGQTLQEIIQDKIKVDGTFI